MPEIWMKYGSTDVVLDIKFENLSSQVSSNLKTLSDEQIRADLEAIPVTDCMLILALSSSKSSARVIRAIFDNTTAKGFTNIVVDVPAVSAGSLRTNLAAFATDPHVQTISINRIDYASLAERASKFQSIVIVSQMAYDPLFGFAGAPSALMRNLYREKMVEAFSVRNSNLPVPGLEGGPLKVALDAVGGLQATSVEIVADSTGIAGVHTGTVSKAFSNALTQFKNTTEIQTDPARSAIISASSEQEKHTTLACSLNSLWNSVHSVKEGGTAVLLAECKEGLGGGALQAYVEGRIDQEHIVSAPYSEGLEHLLFLQELKQKKELGLISTLPNYYATKLGFTTFSGARDALESLLVKHGKSHKALVVADADITLLKTAA